MACREGSSKLVLYRAPSANSSIKFSCSLIAYIVICLSWLTLQLPKAKLPMTNDKTKFQNVHFCRRDIATLKFQSGNSRQCLKTMLVIRVNTSTWTQPICIADIKFVISSKIESFGTFLYRKSTKFKGLSEHIKTTTCRLHPRRFIKIKRSHFTCRKWYS